LVAATTVACELESDWNGAARTLARALGALDGRNWELEPRSTLEIDGRRVAATTARATHPRMMAKRWRTLNRPRAANNAVVLPGVMAALSRLGLESGQEDGGTEKPAQPYVRGRCNIWRSGPRRPDI
jgi:hypothetical protein